MSEAGGAYGCTPSEHAGAIRRHGTMLSIRPHEETPTAKHAWNVENRVMTDRASFHQSERKVDPRMRRTYNLAGGRHLVYRWTYWKPDEGRGDVFGQRPPRRPHPCAAHGHPHPYPHTHARTNTPHSHAHARNHTPHPRPHTRTHTPHTATRARTHTYMSTRHPHTVTHPSIHAVTHSSIHSSFHSFTHSFIHSSPDLPLCG